MSENLKVEAMLHSVNDFREVEIERSGASNDNLIAVVDGVRCTAIFNPFRCCYYVDDVYGRVEGR